MRKLLLTTAAAMLITAGAAHAGEADKGWYVSGGAGASWTQDNAFSNGGFAGGDANYDDGNVAAIASVGYNTGSLFGYNLFGNSWRLEAEGGFRTSGIDNIGPNNATSGGHINVYSLLANAIYDIPTGTRFTPHLGGGVGAAVADVTAHDAAARANDSDVVFAYQGIAGVDYKFTSNWAAGVDYRYFGTSGISVDGANVEYGNHAVLASLRYTFAQPTTPAPMPVAEPVKTKTTTTAVTTVKPAETADRYTVYFALNSSKLNAEGTQVVKRAAEAAKSEKTSVIKLTANADTTGKPAYNQRLSAARANAVKSVLVANGVPAADIKIMAKGEKDLPVATADGVVEPHNRAVMIVLD